ncbi:BACON domain-containing protein [Phocaeicola plebeius]|uniref:M64 family metallo-endopeptidase n=1 Tax=Phocaeicola plebeius TaxID=310297 RepID=A0A921HM30_9BACT|nr:M64 family metallopeptidase [Phocaeicola plebeius]HJF81786.1 M64 family metallo-endopeptidase [Phocaeicola plebeius]
MKTTLFNLCLAFLTLFISCHKEMESVAFENVTESVTLQSVVGDEAFISFTSLGTWNVTTDAAWLSLSPLSGDAGEGQVKVTAVFENNSNQVREAKVKLTSGDEACEISVFQEVGDYVLPEKEEYLIGVEGGVFTIYFETNVDVEKLKVYTSSEPGSWLRQETTSRSAASETHEVSLHATSNKGGMSRSAYLLFVREEDGVQKELATVKISQQGGQVLESVDFSEDGKIDTLQQHAKGEGIPIVLMGDGFVDQELADGTYRRVMEKAMENLFTEEPVKSLREYFDVFMINAVSENNDFGMGYKTAFSCKLAGGNSTVIKGDDVSVQVYVGKVLKEEKKKNSLAVVVLNTSVYAGTTYLGYQDGNGKFIEFAIAYCPVIETLESEHFRQVLVHEAVGHGIGKLEDEYVYPDKGNVTTLEMQRIRTMQANGWAQNVDFTASKDTVLWASFLTDSRYQNEHLGVYEGACTYPKGAYRPSEDSMMNSNTCAFNAPSRKSLYEKVMKIGMDTEQVLYEDFVTFDKAHLPEMLPVASYTRAALSGQSFARPVWTGSRLSH